MTLARVNTQLTTVPLPAFRDLALLSAGKKSIVEVCDTKC